MLTVWLVCALRGHTFWNVQIPAVFCRICIALPQHGPYNCTVWLSLLPWLVCTGLFKVVAEDMPYSSVEEMVGLLPVDVDVVGSFSFVTRTALTIDNFSMAPGQMLTLLSSEQGCARCQVTGPEGSKVEVRIPLGQCGSFYECQDEHGYLLREILSSERLRSRRFRSVMAKACGGPLVFSPIYQIEAIMHSKRTLLSSPFHSLGSLRVENHGHYIKVDLSPKKCLMINCPGNYCVNDTWWERYIKNIFN